MKPIEEILTGTPIEVVDLLKYAIAVLIGGGGYKIFRAWKMAKKMNHDLKKEDRELSIRMVVEAANYKDQAIQEYKDIVDGLKKQFDEFKAEQQGYTSRMKEQHEQEIKELTAKYESKIKAMEKRYQSEIQKLKSIIEELKTQINGNQ